MPRVTSNDGQFMAFIEPGLHRGEIDIRDMRFRNEAGAVWEKATEPVTVQLKEIELSDVKVSNNQQLPKGSVLFRKKFGADGERVQAQTADTGIGASVTLSYDDGTIAVDQLSGGTGYTNVEFLINGGAYDSIMEGITEEILIEYNEEGGESKTLTVTLEGRGGFQDAPVVSYVKNMGEGEEVAETDKYVILPGIASDAVFSGYIVPWEGTSIIRNRNPSNLIRIGDAWAWNGIDEVPYTLYFNDDADSVKVVANSQGVVSLASDDVLHLRVDNGTFVAATVNGVRSTTPFAGLDTDNWTFRYSGGAGLQLTPTIAGGVITGVQLDSSVAAGYASAPSVLVRSAGTLTDAFERVGEVTKDWDPASDSTLFADFIPSEEDGWTDAHRDANLNFEVVSLGSFTEAPGGVATGIVMETLKIAHYRFAVREMKIANRAVSESEVIHDGLVADRDAAADTPFKLKNAAGEFVSVNDAVASVEGAQSVVGGLRAVVPQGRDRVTMVGEPGVLYFVSVRRGEDPEIRAGSSRVSARSSETKDVAIRTGVSRIMTINPFVGGIREAQAQVNALRGPPANTALLREVTRIVRGILTRYAQGDRLRRFLTTYPGMMMEYMYDMSSVNLYSSWDENQRGVVLKALALALADFPSLTLNDRDTELLGEDTAVLSLSEDYPTGDGVNVVSSVPVTAPGAKSDRVRFAKRNTEGYSFTSIRTVDELGTHHVQVNVDQSDAALSKEDHKLLHGMHLDFVPMHKYESEFYVRYYNSDRSRHCTVSFSGSGGDLVPIADSELDLYPM
jgi:hypothetical protein